MTKDPDWWDRVYTVMDTAMLDGNWPIYMDEDPCQECGSQFPGHHCHMEEEQR